MPNHESHNNPLLFLQSTKLFSSRHPSFSDGIAPLPTTKSRIYTNHHKCLLSCSPLIGGPIISSFLLISPWNRQLHLKHWDWLVQWPELTHPHKRIINNLTSLQLKNISFTLKTLWTHWIASWVLYTSLITSLSWSLDFCWNNNQTLNKQIQPHPQMEGRKQTKPSSQYCSPRKWSATLLGPFFSELWSGCWIPMEPTICKTTGPVDPNKISPVQNSKSKMKTIEIHSFSNQTYLLVNITPRKKKQVEKMGIHFAETLALLLVFMGFYFS